MTIEFNTNSGRKIKIDSIQISNSYSGFLAIDTILHANEIVIEHLECPKNWGKRKFLKLLPNSEEMKILLRTTVYVWLSSAPINSSSYGSELVCCWLDNFEVDESMKNFLVKKLQNLDWELEAEDYLY
ncbi:MAG: hypothetical protein RIQ33_2428 [Bacteroidota bacterium]|jgi:hypothetical protein